MIDTEPFSHPVVVETGSVGRAQEAAEYLADARPLDRARPRRDAVAGRIKVYTDTTRRNALAEAAMQSEILVCGDAHR